MNGEDTTDQHCRSVIFKKLFSIVNKNSIILKKLILVVTDSSPRILPCVMHPMFKSLSERFQNGGYAGCFSSVSYLQSSIVSRDIFLCGPPANGMCVCTYFERSSRKEIHHNRKPKDKIQSTCSRTTTT